MEITRVPAETSRSIHLSGLFEYHDESKLLTAMRQSVGETPDIIAIDLAGGGQPQFRCMAALLNMLKIADEASCSSCFTG